VNEASYQIVVGLEVHVQLQTRTKLFCGCSTQFGQPPNTQTCPVCIGMPGVLPVMNRAAFELALKAGMALNCQIADYTKWDRKNYYYPDLPKGFQTSQFDLPFSHDGWLEIDDPTQGGQRRRIGIIRAHLEEDAGKSMHDEHAGVADSRIDLNRVGTPLLEIVSQPDLRSPEEAKAYLDELKLIMTYLEVSDCNMQEGSLRVDANVNLHVKTSEGTVSTPIVEVKNLNSFRAVERAVQYEATRQYTQWQQTGRKLGDVPKQTRGWDDAAGITRARRHKEESSDYRYFPEPDLVPVTVSEEKKQQVRESLGELPQALRSRLEDEYEITPYDADVLVNQGRELVRYYEELSLACGDGKLASNWVQQSVLRTLNEESATIQQYPVTAGQLGDLLKRIKAGQLDTGRGREVLAQMSQQGQSAAEAIAALGIEQVDAGQLRTLCQELVAGNPRIVADIKAGKTKAAGAFVGQAKKQNPNVVPAEVIALCIELALES
jgi:aspartyl-tRNA(Asn)/glutamyl-tRNA(Gln) amidotransferase subunit B